jgi:hypothetical protein
MMLFVIVLSSMLDSGRAWSWMPPSPLFRMMLRHEVAGHGHARRRRGDEHARTAVPGDVVLPHDVVLHAETRDVRRDRDAAIFPVVGDAVRRDQVARRRSRFVGHQDAADVVVDPVEDDLGVRRPLQVDRFTAVTGYRPGVGAGRVHRGVRALVVHRDMVVAHGHVVD